MARRDPAERPDQPRGDDLHRPRHVGRRFTDRQAEVLALVAAGLANKQIAERMGLSEQSVKEHVSHLLRALSVSNRAALGEAAATLRLVGTTDIARDWLAVLFEQSPLRIAVFSGSDHVFVAANAAYRQAAARDDLVGLTYREAFPGLEGAGVYERFDQVLADGRPVVLHEVAGRFDREGAGELTDGFSTVLMQPLPGPDGRPSGVAVISLDVTDHVLGRGTTA